MTTKKVLIGGSFAPPLTEEKLKEYKLLAASAEPKISEVMLKLIEMVEVFNETPTSTLPPEEYMIDIVDKIPLEDKEIQRIWNYVPWDYELDAYGNLFETIGYYSNKPLRNACFHLLWFARELEADREPITNDKLFKKSTSEKPVSKPEKSALTSNV